MNKLTKAAIAGAAGIALLLGGAGSLAYWNASAGLGSTSIDAGNLTMTASGTWSDTITKWVPGDDSTYTGTLDIVATGDNFKGELTFDESSIVSNGLADVLDIDFTVTTLPAGITGTPGGPYTIASAGTYSVPVTVTVAFPYGTVIDNLSQDQSVALANIKFNVKQLQP